MDRVPIDIKAGHFYSFHPMYVLMVNDVKAKTKISYNKHNVNCMFNIHDILDKDKNRIGYAFSSAFDILNTGTYIITKMHRHRDINNYTVLIRTKEVILFNYPNVGALAISTKVSPFIKNIIEEQ